MSSGASPSNEADESHALPMGDGLRAAMALLRRALDCARDAQAPPWDFAVEIGHLYAAGLTITDLRWLVAKELVEHADETSVHGDEHRSFSPCRGLNFLPTTCVVLTTKGVVLAEGETTLLSGDVSEATARSVSAVKPHWDSARRRLSLGGRVVKQFHVPAKNQELILTAFEDVGWPESILDPLAIEFDLDPKTRLNDVVYRLNHKQRAALIRFHVSGCGHGVHWSLRPARELRRHATAGTLHSQV